MCVSRTKVKTQGPGHSRQAYHIHAIRKCGPQEEQNHLAMLSRSYPSLATGPLQELLGDLGGTASK